VTPALRSVEAPKLTGGVPGCVMREDISHEHGRYRVYRHLRTVLVDCAVCGHRGADLLSRCSSNAGRFAHYKLSR